MLRSQRLDLGLRVVSLVGVIVNQVIRRGKILVPLDQILLNILIVVLVQEVEVEGEELR